MSSSTQFWTRFFARRLVRLAFLVPLVAASAFVLLSLSPIDPIQAYIGDRMGSVSAEQGGLIAAKWGLDQPPLVRFWKWAGNIAQGDLGVSMTFSRPVAAILVEKARASLLLMACAWLLSGLAGFGLGILAGAFEGRWIDRLIRTYAFILASAPTFWAAILFLFVFSIELGWTPFCCAGPPGTMAADITVADRLKHLALPALTLSLLGVAQVTLHTRDKLREVMASDYATLAFAQGLGRLGVALRHGLRNAALPAVMLQFAHFGELFGGSILAETVFAYPGLGQATVLAGTRGDAPLLLGIAIVAAAFVFTGNMLADIFQLLLDPRHRDRPEEAA